MELERRPGVAGRGEDGVGRLHCGGISRHRRQTGI